MDLYHLQADKLIRQYQPLIYKVMHQCHVNQYHYLYDDCYQELSIKLIDVWQQFDGNPFVEADQPRFLYMAKQSLHWRLIDLFRKEQRQPDTSDLEKVAPSVLLDNQSMVKSESTIVIQTFMAKAKERLDGDEFSLLVDLIEGNNSTKELATYYQVSRQTIYSRKRKIREKLSELHLNLI